MITVPCCYEHNQEYKLLDEKIRNHMAFLVIIRSIPVEKGRQAVLNSPKLARDFLSHTKELPTLKGEDGKPRISYVFDKTEIDKWLIRIVKGIYFWENRKRIAEDAIFRPEVIYDIMPQSSASFPMEKGLERRPYFIYGVTKVEQNPAKELWGLVFYDKLLFIVEVIFPNS